jgi:secreted protein with Ig-like and vWFA domain
LSHPGGGVSSSGTSTTTAWMPLIGVGAGEIDGTVTAVVMTAVAAATTYCGSAAAAALREGSLVTVAVLPVTRGALDERRLVGMDVSALSAFAGARGGTVGATLRARN